jgi:hypothetical protein
MSTLAKDRMVKNRKVLALEIVGTIFIILLGSILHFTYALSGNNLLVGFFSAVNESVWEHLKLAFWPSLLWMLIMMTQLRNAINNFLPAKVFGTYVMVAFIPAVFYSYTAFTGESIFAIDIATFVVAVIVGQLVSYQLYKYRTLPRSADKIAIVAMILLAAAFISFTFYAPHLPIFQDPVTSQYGV